MAFYKVCLVYLTVLLILPEQGRPQCYSLWPRSSGSISPPCCSTVSTAYISEPFVSCFEQKESTSSSHCRRHAFIFTSVNRRHYCVDAEAKWLSQRFRRLQNRGICCYVQ
ncbi:hypothetical protein VZT92_012228 [Zoarces viviparus]|uniref:Chemokine interleukin-8-like domain-containing protein n=1 Tax=Zoarces viviparus TaxID=48416 RepID=A0AAW1F7K9_ZOAVI